MYRVRINISEDVRRAREAQGKMASDRKTILERIGIQALSLAQLAYREKARGGTGSDGITWAKLSRETIEARVRSRAPAKRIVAQRKQIASQISATKGKGSNAKRARLVKQRKELLARLQSLIDTEYSRHEIGVDTGLQRSSAQPGFAGSDGKGGNIMKLDCVSVTVGYGRQYSKYFDEKRPLLPAVLPPSWVTSFDQLVDRWLKEIMRDSGLGNS